MSRTYIGSRSVLDADEELNLYVGSIKGYTKGGECDYTHVYPEVIDTVCDRWEVSPDKVVLLDHEVVGEICIYVNGKWSGYVSEIYKEEV